MLNYAKYYGMSLLSLVAVANLAIVAQASDSKDLKSQLDSVAEPIYLSKNESEKEYTFKAPDNKTLTNSEQLTAASGYKVEVYGSASELLHRVRDIEPKAFIKGNVIQVGIFSEQNNAEDMVRKLTGEGFWSRIVADWLLDCSSPWRIGESS